MTSGRWIVLAILGITAVFAGAQWWFQTRAYYEPVALDTLPVTLADGETVNLQLAAAEAIDADTSPLRFRACLTVGPDEAAQLLAQGVPAEEPTPLIAPDWFECFDAEAIGAALEAGQAQAILSQTEVRPGADRIMAVFPDGRVYVWHQWNGSLEG
jgi:hypothetical protein